MTHRGNQVSGKRVFVLKPRMTLSSHRSKIILRTFTKVVAGLKQDKELKVASCLVSSTGLKVRQFLTQSTVSQPGFLPADLNPDKTQATNLNQTNIELIRQIDQLTYKIKG